MYVGAATAVFRAAANKRKTGLLLFVSDVMKASVGVPWQPTLRAQREGDGAPPARYPIAQGGGEQPLPVHPAVRGSQGGVLGSCKVSRLARMRRDLDEEHGEESRHRVERIMTELWHDGKASAKSPSCGGPPETTYEHRG